MKNSLKKSLTNCVCSILLAPCVCLAWLAFKCGCLSFSNGRPSRETRRSLITLPKNVSKPQLPPGPPISRTARNEQVSCLLFKPDFPLEMRNMIYEAVLGDPNILMHIIPFEDGSNRVGRRRCYPPDYDGGYGRGPRRHICYDDYLRSLYYCEPPKLVEEYEAHCRDQLLALVLTCHRMYV